MTNNNQTSVKLAHGLKYTGLLAVQMLIQRSVSFICQAHHFYLFADATWLTTTQPTSSETRC